MFNLSKKIFFSVILLLLAWLSIFNFSIAMAKKNKVEDISTEKINNSRDRYQLELLSDDFLVNADDFFAHTWPSRLDTQSVSYVPRINIQESENNYHIEAELPGIKKEDIEIILKDDFLLINGERKNVILKEKEQYRRLERSSGSFHRTISVPRDINRDTITAELSDGILKIDIHKNNNVKHSEKKILLK